MVLLKSGIDFVLKFSNIEMMLNNLSFSEGSLSFLIAVKVVRDENLAAFLSQSQFLQKCVGLLFG